METYEFMRVLGERSNRVDRLYYKWAKAHGFSYNVLAVLLIYMARTPLKRTASSVALSMNGCANY